MKAKRILKDRTVYEGGYIQEMVIWEVPQPVAGSEHLYKYRLFFGLPGERIVGYDNEHPQGRSSALRRTGRGVPLHHDPKAD